MYMITPRFTKNILTLAFALALFPVAHVFAQEALDCTTALADAEMVVIYLHYHARYTNLHSYHADAECCI